MPAAAPSTLMEHVRELRSRLTWSVAVFLGGGVLGYLWHKEIIAWLQHPLHETLYYTTPTGSFEVIMQVCSLIGLLLALPVLVFHLLRFIEPALPRNLSWRLLASIISLSFTLAVGGAAFAYYISLPTALSFFASMGTNQLQALISVDRYFRFVFVYLGTFAVMFQLPLLLLFIDHITPLKPGSLRKWRKFVIAGAFGIALITPTAPDPLSQIILALPIIVLYELALFMIWIRHNLRQRRVRTALRRQPPAPTAATEPAPTQAATLTAPTPPSAPSHRTRRPAPPRPVPQHAGIIDLRLYQPRPAPRPISSPNLLDLRNL